MDPFTAFILHPHSCDFRSILHEFCINHFKWCVLGGKGVEPSLENGAVIFMGLDHSLSVRSKIDNSQEERLAVFRKFNALQGYMERLHNVQNTVDEIVPRTTIEHLNEIATKILDSKSDEVSFELLPPTAGFFYGSTDCDEYYYEDVQLLQNVTKLILDKYSDELYDVIYWCWW